MKRRRDEPIKTLNGAVRSKHDELNCGIAERKILD